ncbi:MAG: bifunctional oligoribonuclease/PAP phosphatase NrnA [Candidatus Thorarchaeota archaeon]
MLKSKFEDFKIFLKNKNVLITTHDLADIDGLASCFVLKFFFNHYYNSDDIHLVFPEISKSTKDFFFKLKEKFPEVNFSLKNDVDIGKIDVIIILDTNNLGIVKFSNNFNIINSNIPFVFLDHHLNLEKEYSNNISSLNIIDDKFSSTAEIIFEMCEYFNVKISLPYKYLLIAAILTDSGFFKHGNNDTILRVSRLLTNQLNYQEILSMLKAEKEISKKISKIKAIQRVQLIQQGNWLIGLTNIGSYEASVASSLIKLGCDVGVVYSEKKLDYRISIRAKKNTCLKTGLHLGKILKEISEEYGGSGGGHDGAASLKGNVDLKRDIDIILDKIKQVLNK